MGLTGMRMSCNPSFAVDIKYNSSQWQFAFNFIQNMKVCRGQIFCQSGGDSGHHNRRKVSNVHNFLCVS